MRSPYAEPAEIAAETLKLAQPELHGDASFELPPEQSAPSAPLPIVNPFAAAAVATTVFATAFVSGMRDSATIVQLGLQKALVTGH